MGHTILIAGGTGLIGKALEAELTKQGHTVRILTRNPTLPQHFFWNPYEKEVDRTAFNNVQIIINLCGASLGSKKWTPERKKELYNSRILTTEFLYKETHHLPELEHYLTASGITCYGFDDDSKNHEESDPFGKAYLGRLVQDWEHSADEFSTHCRVTKIRTAVVLSKNAPALKAMLRPIKSGFGSAVGSGKQWFPWIHIDDLVGIYSFVIDKKLIGPYNAVAGVPNNKEFLKTSAKVLNKPFWSPKVPEFLVRSMFGEMADIVLKGQKVSNAKIKSKGYTFQHEDLEETLTDILQPN